jgi:SGNH domain (fused to AT3 domains)
MLLPVAGRARSGAGSRAGGGIADNRLWLAAGALGLAAVLGASWLITQQQRLFDKNTRAQSRAVAQGGRDRGRNIKAKCNRTFGQTDQPLCAYGDTTATRTVVLFGDSHAAQWFEAVDKAARQNGWRLLAWTKSACPPTDATIWHRRMPAPFTACDQWREGVMARMIGSEKPNLVLISSYVDSGVLTLDPAGAALAPELAEGRWRDGLARTIGRLSAAGVPVVLIADTPRARRRFADCLALGGGSACDRPRADALPRTRLDHEAAVLAGIPVLDLTDRICGPETCVAKQGQQLVYRDEHHLTARFALSLADAFLPLLPPTSGAPLRGAQPGEPEPAPSGVPAITALR